MAQRQEGSGVVGFSSPAHERVKWKREDSMPIERKIGQIWIGPKPAPTRWMDSWKTIHPDLPYTLYDNAYLTGRRFRTQALIEHYFARREFAGVADLMRYEILFEHGGFMPEADSTAAARVDPLFEADQPFTCYEIDPTICHELGMPRKVGLICPILGSPQAHPVLGALIKTLAGVPVSDSLGKPWAVTGNKMLREFFRKRPKLAAQLTIYPAHYFVPEHYRGWRYQGDGPVYAHQHWGTTRDGYAAGEMPTELRQNGPTFEDVLARLRSWL